MVYIYSWSVLHWTYNADLANRSYRTQNLFLKWYSDIYWSGYYTVWLIEGVFLFVCFFIIFFKEQFFIV